MFLPAGTRLNQYEVIAPLGAGGMGEVYVAEDLQLRRRVALKVLPSDVSHDPDRQRRFELEARATSALNHPNIVTVYGSGLAAQGHFIAMELVEGRTLREWARQSSAIDGVVRVGQQVAEALRVAHGAGIIHRDIKPENILVRDDGYVKVLDFGLARLKTPTDEAAAETMAATLPGMLVGTVQYMSPEQGRGDGVTTATDIFSLGLVLYEMATGRHVFAATGPMQVLQGILSDHPLPPARLNPEIPEPLNALILDMLRKDPRSRPSADDVQQELAAMAGGAPSRTGEPDSPRRRRFTVGREAELADLRAAFDAVALGQGQVVSIGGEPGAGKTTLVDQFLSDLISDRVPCRIARGRCSERLAGTEAYGAWLEALEGLMHDGAGAVARALKTLAPAWYREISSLADPSETALTTEPAAASQERLNRELASLLRELSRPEPVVFFIDDMQWADTSTTDLVGFLAERCDGLGVLLVVTYRPSDLLLGKHQFAILKTALQARGVCRDVGLGLLTSTDVERYLAREFPGHDFPAAFAARIHARTEGNPLFVSELLRHLRDTRAIVREGDAWIVNRPLDEIDRDLPESMRGMIERKLSQLADEDRRLLAAASVQGYEFDSTVVAVALSRDPADVEERLEVLDRVHAFVRIVDEREFPDHTLTSRYRFIHVLYQNALFDSLRPTRRTQVAGDLGRALERYWGVDNANLASELALLFEAARAFARAADYFRLAAQNAAKLFAAREAVDLARRSLDMLEKLPPDRDRHQRELSTLIVLGNALIATGGYAAPHVEDTYVRAAGLCKELGDTPDLLPATWGLYQYKLIRANYGEILEHADELLQLFKRGDDSAMVIADRLVGLAFLLTGNLARGRLHFDRIVSTYVPARHRPLTWEYAQEPGMAGHALLGLTLWLLGYPDQALVHGKESERLGRDVPQHNSQANALFWACTHHQFRNEPRRVAELAKELISLASDQGLKFWLAVGACQLGTALVAEGAAGEGLEKMRRGIAGSRGAGAELLQSFNFCALGAAYGRAARPREGLAALDEAEALVTVHHERFWEAEIHRLRGELLLMDGADPLQAVAHFEQSINVARGQGAKSLELRASTSLSRLWRQLGRRAEAKDMLTSMYGWFVEGFDTPDLKDACALIGELREAS